MTNATRPRALLQNAVSLLLLLFSGTFLAAPAFAQSHWMHNHVDLFAEGGGSLFTPGQATVGTSIAEMLSSGNPTVTQIDLINGSLHDAGRLFVGADFWFTRKDAVQVNYSYSPANETFTAFSFYPAPSTTAVTDAGTASLRMHFITVDYLRAFQVAFHWRWFLDAGLGGVDWRGNFAPSFRFAVNIGTGVSFRLTPRWSLRAEYRDYMVRFPYSSPLMHNHAPTLGIVFHF